MTGFQFVPRPSDHLGVTADTCAPTRTSPTGRVPLWSVLEDAMTGVADRAWPATPLPPAPAQLVHRATARPGPTTLRGRAGLWVLDRTVVVAASAVLAVLGALGLGD